MGPAYNSQALKRRRLLGVIPHFPFLELGLPRPWLDRLGLIERVEPLGFVFSRDPQATRSPWQTPREGVKASVLLSYFRQAPRNAAVVC